MSTADWLLTIRQILILSGTYFPHPEVISIIIFTVRIVSEALC